MPHALSAVSLLALTGIFHGSVAWAVQARGRAEGAATAYSRCGFNLEGVDYFNFQLLPSPMDRLLPSLTARRADRVERQARGRWRRWLAAGFMVRARRR